MHPETEYGPPKRLSQGTALAVVVSCVLSVLKNPGEQVIPSTSNVGTSRLLVSLLALEKSYPVVSGSVHSTGVHVSFVSNLRVCSQVYFTVAL